MVGVRTMRWFAGLLLAIFILSSLISLIPSRASAQAPEAQSPVRGSASEGENWFITWTATANGNSDVTDEWGRRRQINHQISLTGSGIASYSEENGGTGWKTRNFQWTLADNYQKVETDPCPGGGRERTTRSVTNPNQEPLWVDSFLVPSSVSRRDDGSLYTFLWFVHSTAGMPWFPSKTNIVDTDCQGKSDTYTYTTEEDAGYASVLFYGDPNKTPDPRWGYLFPWGNEPGLECDATGTTCWRNHSYKTEYEPFHDVNWQIRMRRLPDTPTINQVPELLESGVYLPGVPLSDRIDGQLDCDKNATCYAKREVREADGSNTVEQFGPVPSGNYPKTVDIGTLKPGTSRVTAQAESATAGPPDTKQIQVAQAVPAWANGALNVVARKIGPVAEYTWEAKFPEPAIKKEFTAPSFVPFFGGKKIFVELPQAGFKTEAKSTGEVSVEGSIGGTIGLGDSSIGMQFAGRATGVLDLRGVRDVKGEVDIKVFGKVTAEAPLVSAIPALKPGVETIRAFSTTAAEFLENRAKAILEVEPSWTTTAALSDKTGKIDIDNAVIAPAIAVKVKALLKAVEGIVEGSVYTGGDIKATFPTPPFQMKDIGFTLVVGAEIIVFHFNLNPSESITCTFPGGCTNSGTNNAGLTAAEASGWTLSNRDYLNDPDYANWTAPDAATAAGLAAAGDLAAKSTTDVQLATNVYPQARPSLAVNGSQRLITWSHDRPDLPATGAQEIHFSTSAGSGQPWSAGAAVTNDTQADFNRQVAWTESDTAVAVWQRFDSSTPGDFSADPKGYLSHVQVAAATWDGAAWSAPVQLSTSGSLNSRPHLTALSDGALAVWVGNAGNQIVGDATNPDTLYFARFSNVSQTWSAPAPIVSDVRGLLSLRLAGNDTHAAIIYTLDGDGSLTTDTDQELQYILWSGGAWGTPAQLTSNTVPDDSPQLTLTSTGSPNLVWRQNGGLKFLTGSWTSPTITDLALPDAARGGELRLTSSLSTNGDLALTWQQLGGNQTGIGYAHYDGESGLWSSGLAVTPPITGTAEGLSYQALNVDSALESDHLLLAYQSAVIEPITVTQGGITVPNVPRTTSHDLRYAEVSLGRNLVLTPADVSIAPAGGTGAVVTVTVRNTGQRGVPAAQLVVRNQSGSETFASQTVGPIVGGGSVTVSLPLTTTVSETPLAVVVDPDHNVQETNERDNEARLGSAIALTPLATEYLPLGMQVSAVASRPGTLQHTEALTASVRLDTPDGPELAVSPISFSESTGASPVTATAVLTPGQVGAGRHLVYWLLYQDGASEPVVAGVSAAHVLPDYAVHPAEVSFGTAPGATAPISITLENRGNVMAPAGSIAVYDKDPVMSGAVRLGTLAVPEVTPGNSASIGGTLDLSGSPAAGTGLSGIYLHLDPDNLVDETNESNNLLLAGKLTATGPAPTPEPYDPTKQRVYLPISTRLQAGGW